MFGHYLFRTCISILIVVAASGARYFVPTPASGQTSAKPAPAAFPFKVSSVTRVAQLIGPTPKSPAAPYAPAAHSINNTTSWGICSGDLGSLMVDGGKAYIALGDDYTSCPPGTGGPGGGLAPPDWRSNALGIIPNPANFTKGLHITRWFSHNGKRAAEVIHSGHDAANCEATEFPSCEITRIPTYGFASQHHLFLAFMSVHHWGDPGKWNVNYSSFSMSADAGKSWKVETHAVSWGAHSNFAQMAVTPDPTGAYLLFYGIPGGRFGSVKLMRCPNTWRAVLNQSDYQYFTGRDGAGNPQWSRSPASAVDVSGAPTGELSVIYDPGLKQWLMTYLQGAGNLVIRGASHYWGPWSAPATLATQERFPGLYGAFMNPHFLANGGHTIFFDMSQWNQYCVFWMKATLSPRGAR